VIVHLEILSGIVQLEILAGIVQLEILSEIVQREILSGIVQLEILNVNIVWDCSAGNTECKYYLGLFKWKF
jgi:hypothetical protein